MTSKIKELDSSVRWNDEHEQQELKQNDLEQPNLRINRTFTNCVSAIYATRITLKNTQ